MIDIQPRSDVAFHVQRLAEVVTFTALVPPPESKFRDEVDTL
jgi:hypothetical protein